MRVNGAGLPVFGEPHLICAKGVVAGVVEFGFVFSSCVHKANFLFELCGTACVQAFTTSDI